VTRRKVACDRRQSMMFVFPATDADDGALHIFVRNYGSSLGPTRIHHILAPDGVGRFINLCDKPDPTVTLHCARGLSTITARPETGPRTVVTFTSFDNQTALSFTCRSFQSQCIRGLIARASVASLAQLTAPAARPVTAMPLPAPVRALP